MSLARQCTCPHSSPYFWTVIDTLLVYEITERTICVEEKHKTVPSCEHVSEFIRFWSPTISMERSCCDTSPAILLFSVTHTDTPLEISHKYRTRICEFPQNKCGRGKSGFSFLLVCCFGWCLDRVNAERLHSPGELHQPSSSVHFSFLIKLRGCYHTAAFTGMVFVSKDLIAVSFYCFLIRMVRLFLYISI